MKDRILKAKVDHEKNKLKKVQEEREMAKIMKKQVAIDAELKRQEDEIKKEAEKQAMLEA